MTFKDLTKLDLTQFEKGEKITVIKQGEFGFPVAYQMKLDMIFLKDWAQYKNSIQVQGKPPRKRKLRAFIIKPCETFYIYKGFVDVKDTSKTISEKNGVTLTSLGTCFDENTLTNSLPEGYVLSSEDI